MSIMNSTKDEIREMPIGVKWEWDESKKCLTYKTHNSLNDKNEKKKTKDGKIDLRSGAPRLVTQIRQNKDSSSSTKNDPKKKINSHVTIGDVKNAAIQILSERYFIPNNFEEYCNDPNSRIILEEFLLCLANYFYWYFESIDSKIMSNPMCIERSETEKKRSEKAEIMLNVTLKYLSKNYCMLILGLDADDYHHMNCGKNRVSSGFKDRGLFETFYPFCVFFIWVTFKRRDYEIIRTEVGRILRSEAFNSSLKVESILDDDNFGKKLEFEKSRNKTAILYKFEENRILLNEFVSKIQNKTSTATLTKRSPALVSLLPLPQENSKWLFSRRGGNALNLNSENEQNSKIENESENQMELMNEVGIIGLPMKLFHVKTLTSRGNSDEDTSADPKSETNQEKHEADPQEQSQ